MEIKTKFGIDQVVYRITHYKGRYSYICHCFQIKSINIDCNENGLFIFYFIRDIDNIRFYEPELFESLEDAKKEAKRLNEKTKKDSEEFEKKFKENWVD